MLSNRTALVLAVTLAALTALSGCGDADATTAGSAPTTSTSTSSATASTPQTAAAIPTTSAPSATELPAATSIEPHAVAAGLKDEISQIGKIVEITEDNDANDLIGRPGQYDAATFMQDTRLTCTAKDDFDDLSIDCGAKIERWPTNADAKARAADIQKKLKDYGLGAEYDYVRENLVLRVAGDLKPSAAKKYQQAFSG